VPAVKNLPSELEWIDAHHHLWDLSRIEYPWLLAKGEVRFFGQPDPIRKNYLVGDYRDDTDGKISRSVHIQVGASEGQELGETRFINECAEQTGRCFPAAAVVAVDLGQRDIEKQLEAQQSYTVTRGVRHMIGKSVEENPFLPPFEPEVWVGNWRLVSDRGLSFDLQLTEEQYEKVLAVLEQVPELRVAMCHLASPWDRSAEGLKRWKTWMKRFAGLPNMVMKISGLNMFTKQWDEQEFLRWGEMALEIFGAGRCMLGSNFPVDKLYVSYDELFMAWQKLVSQCSREEAVQLAGQTAKDFYHL
jgi:predicted TIM-barrel fold metal-dependent hydrolase